MSHTDPQPSSTARNHTPAIIAIIVALAVAVAAFLFFGGSDPAPDDPQEGEAVGTAGGVTEPPSATPAPATTTTTPAPATEAPATGTGTTAPSTTTPAPSN